MQFWRPPLVFVVFPTFGGGTKTSGAWLLVVVGQQLCFRFQCACVAKLPLTIPGAAPLPPCNLFIPYFYV